MKNKIFIILILYFILSGCGTTSNSSEKIVAQGRESLSNDNTLIIAPDGYFLNSYEWKEVDDHTKQLVLTLTDNKRLGEK